MVNLPSTEKKEQFIPTEEEANRLIQVLLDEPWQYRMFYLLAICTGCRRGELCALKWSDFEFLESGEIIITVSRSRSNVAGRGIMEGSTKNGKTRTIYLDKEMSALLLEYQINQLRPGGYLFTDEYGHPIHPDTFTKHLRKIYKRNGFPETFHLHTLRHYYVSTLLHHGVDKQTVAELVGHVDTSFLEQTYSHP